MYFFFAILCRKVLQNTILMPLLVLFTLAGVWNNGYEKKQKAINKELDKMKAKDQQSMQ